jgi:hypothetical protein
LKPPPAEGRLISRDSLTDTAEHNPRLLEMTNEALLAGIRALTFLATLAGGG